MIERYLGLIEDEAEDIDDILVEESSDNSEANDDIEDENVDESLEKYVIIEIREIYAVIVINYWRIKQCERTECLDTRKKY